MELNDSLKVVTATYTNRSGLHLPTDHKTYVVNLSAQEAEEVANQVQKSKHWVVTYQVTSLSSWLKHHTVTVSEMLELVYE